MDGPGSGIAALSLARAPRARATARAAALIRTPAVPGPRLDLYYITYNPCSLTNRLNKPA